jgi:transcriptional regulator with XRE-family HTH domain
MVEWSNQEIGEFLREKREESGLSLSGLKEKTGIDRGHMARIEQGVKRPSRALLAKLAPVLVFDVEDVLARVAPSLPALAPYLRAKYDFSDEAVEELERHFEAVRKQFKQSKRGQR